MESESRELLDGVAIPDVNGSQFMIQRMSVDSQQLLTATELLQHHNGLVVDLGAGDFIPVDYTSESISQLLPPDITEEDRNLAAALVAVQLSHQKQLNQQQLQQESNVIISGGLPQLCDDQKVINEQQLLLTDKTSIQGGYLQIVDSENIYKQPLIPKICFDSRDFSQADVYDHSDDMLSVKSEKSSTHRDSDGDQKLDSRNSKKSLPHKKRISRKLRKSNQSLRKVYKCTLCDQIFNSSEDFSAHQNLCQTTITPIHTMFTCQLCSTNFQDQLRFFEHLKGHYEPTHLQKSNTIQKPKELYKPQQAKQQENVISSLLNTCLECNKTFRRQKAYEAHVRDFHNKDDLHEFSGSEDLMADIDVNPSVQPSVHDAKEWYPRDDELQATEEDLRELEAQDYDQKIPCLVCKQQFASRSALHQHSLNCKTVDMSNIKVSNSTDNKKSKKKAAEFKCVECPRVFSHKNSLLYHIRGHSGIRPHTCTICNKSFFAASALKVHMRLHTGDKPYCCEYCGKYFRQWGDLKYHCVSIHSDHKQYQCDYCAKDFARKYSLIVHRRIHTGEKNYKCEFCSKTFRASSYLQNHRRIHTGEKPHTCDLCGKKFRVRSDMKRHFLTHTRKKAGRGDLVVAKLEPKETENSETILPDEDSTENKLNADQTTNSASTVPELQYEPDPLDGIGDSNTLYVMPILIT